MPTKLRIRDARAERVLEDALGDFGRRCFELGQSMISSAAERAEWYGAAYQLFSRGESIDELTDWLVFRRSPVSFKEFVTNEIYLGKATVLYPKVLEALEELMDGPYVEAVFTGGIGSGKTTAAHYTIAYQLYVLSCMRDPHRYFDLDPSSEIVFIFQSLSAMHAKQVEYERFKALISASPYFNTVFPYDKTIKSKLIFPSRIECYSVSGQETAAIGQNVIGGILDEVNYMSITENSKSSVDGGLYDQAWALYSSIARRRKTRFIRRGKTYGMLCLVSSKRYPGQFTDVKEKERDRQLAETGASDIYIYDKRVWEVKTEGSYTGEMFKLFVGDMYRKPRLIEPGEKLSAEDIALTMEIPIEYKAEFERDIINALREIAGVSTLALHPYIMNTDKVSVAMSNGASSVFSRQLTDFDAMPLKLLPGNIANKDEPRWAHIDLSVTSDSTGLVIGHVKGFKKMLRGDVVEYWPEIVVDGALEIVPPKGGEILFHKIRLVLYKLRDLGMNIKWVTFDSYQSVDSIQVLRRNGFSTGMKSVDTDITPYAMTKAALYDERLIIPDHDLLRAELLSVEYNAKKDKVDHPANGSKDCADALAGVVYGLTMRRAIWRRFDISLSHMPAGLKGAKDIDKEEADE